jgi:serine protease Do/serine protease DegQ
MRQQVLCVIAAAALTSSFAASAQLPEKVGDTPLPSLAPIIKRTSPAVVNISTKGTIRANRNQMLDDPFLRRFFDMPQRPRDQPFQSAGSGVIVDAKNGYIITNAHVLDKADEITVMLQDDRQIKAEVIGKDTDSDVAVLKVSAKNLAQMPLADSAKAEVGDFVIAIGNPFGLQHTVTSGIISALGRSGITNEGYEDFIQTDASINPGNSGGALVNLDGQLVGINTAIFSSRSGGNIGIGFAIPSNMVKSVMQQLIQFGEVRRGVLGVQLSQIFTSEMAESLGLESAKGALVRNVVEGSAAEKAGIQAGDVITSLNSRPVASMAELRNSIGLLSIGEKVEIGLMRDGKPRRVTALIGERPDAPAEAAAQIHPALEGAALASAPNGGGVLVQSVLENSPAAQNGLRANDLILQVGRTRIGTLEQLRATVKGPSAFLVTIKRGNRTEVFPIGQ